MFQLEKYKGKSTRYACPSCGSRYKFTRYIDETGNYLNETVGKCDRESKCGYHYKPKQFFADNPRTSDEKGNFKKRKRANSGFAGVRSTLITSADLTPKKRDYIPFELFKQTLGNYDRNAFVQFLLNLFPDCADEVFNALKMYFVGTFEDYTCFPSIDRLNRICRAKLIKFNPLTGKRLKGEYDTSSLPAKLKLKDFRYKQMFFGEHLLKRFPGKPVAIVESEKSAIIGALCFSEFVWLGSNNKSWLNAERLKQIGNRQIILYPDADGFEKWHEIAWDARKLGATVKVSNLIEKNATPEQKAAGCDLADYLINEQIEKMEAYDNYASKYNVAVDSILSDAELQSDFETILDEQKAICIDGGMSETDAENYVCQPDNLRRAATFFL